MKNILTGLIVCCLCLITSNINSQPDCDPMDNVQAEVSNVVCDVMNNLTFDLTLTQDGSPVESGTAELEFLDNTTNASIRFIQIIGATIVNNYPITISGSCPDINSMHISFEKFDGDDLECKPALTAAPATVAVPTLGEWGLIVLFLSLMIMGLVAIRERSFLPQKAI